MFIMLSLTLNTFLLLPSTSQQCIITLMASGLAESSDWLIFVL